MLNVSISLDSRKIVMSIFIFTGPSLFSIIALSDVVTGAIMTVVSLLVLCGCLILLVKLLQSVLQGK